MKNFKIYNILTLLLVVCFNTFSSSAFNSFTYTRDLDPRNFDLSQADINDKGLFFDEISVNTSPQIDPDDQSGTPGILFPGTYFIPFSISHSCSAIGYNFIQDKRGALEAQIFPFHFFW